MSGGCCHLGHISPQRSQRDSPVVVEDQRPLGRAIIAEPIVLHLPLLLAGTNKGRRGGFSRFVQPVGFYQKQFSFS